MRNLAPCIIAGSITGVIQVTYCLSFAVLIFSGRLDSFSTVGINIALLSCFWLTLVMAIKSSMPGVTTGLQGSAAAIMALLATSIAASIPAGASSQELLGTVIAAMGICALLTGGFCWVLGHLRLGNLIRFIPYPVIAGFLGGCGWLIFKGAIEVMIGSNLTSYAIPDLFNPKLVQHWAIGVVMGLLILILMRNCTHWAVLPGCLLGGTSIFYGALSISQISLADARAHGWLLSTTTGTTPWSVLKTLSLADVNWQIIIQHLSNHRFLLPLILLSTLELLFYINSIEIAIGEDFNLDRELKAFGIGTMTSVFWGGMIGCHVLSGAIIANNLKAQKRLTSLIAAGVFILFLALGPIFITLIPRPVLGALLIYLGLLLLVEWLYETYYKLSKLEYFSVLLIITTIIFSGFLEGVAIGLILALVVFALDCSRIPITKNMLSGSEHISNVERCSHEAQILSSNGEQILMVLLQGFIFFGTAHRLLNQIQRRIDDSSREKINFLVLDFRLVNGIDASAIHTFNRLIQIAQKKRINLLFSGWQRNSSPELGTILEKSTIKTFPDLDQTVEWCENAIIQAVSDTVSHFPPVVNEMCYSYTHSANQTKSYSYLALLENLDSEESIQFLSSLNRITLEKAQVLFKKDDLPEAIYFLVSGQISTWIQIGDKDIKRKRLRKFSEGTVIAEISLYGSYGSSKYRTTAIADEPCTLYSLSMDAMLDLERQHPVLMNKVHKFIIDLLAAHLNKLQSELKTLV